MFTTSNGGTNWTARSLPIGVSVTSIAYHADGTIWAVGALGSVQRSTDHGVTWQVIEQGVESGYIRAMSSPTPTQVNMSTTGSHLMVTTNAGTTWTEAAGSPSDWTGLTAIDGALMWRVGQGGLISRTTDGSTWSAQTSGTAQSLHDVVALDRQTVLAFGANGTILRTSNGGTTWTSRSSGTTRTLLDATSPDGNVVYASGTNGTLLRSIDRGLTWTSITSGTTSPLTAVGAWNRDELMVGTGSGALRRSLDGGTTWSTPASPSSAPAITGVEAIPGTQTVWVSWNDNVARSTDRFATYVNIVLPANRPVLSLSATNGQVAVAGREQARMSLTMDGGATWLELDGATASRVIQGVASLGAYSSYGVGETSQTVRSSAPTTIADYDQPTQSWTNGTGFFGICLKSAPGATPAWPTTGSCPQADGTNWRAVPDHGATAQAAVASTIAAGTITSAFQFGIRAPSTQSPGTYLAPITFEVTAPAA